MILICNSCQKKFVVPDKAITSLGRTVQCGSCGNKWKQFPIINVVTNRPVIKKDNKKNFATTNIQKPKKKVKKVREINLYSPEYLAKKHGIKLEENLAKPVPKHKVSFGFYNSLILFLVLMIVILKGLHFGQSFIVDKLPFTEFYIDYFFESMRNIFEIWKDLISNV
jgi:predicted Zn finger-like uncharacterized protein